MQRIIFWITVFAFAIAYPIYHESNKSSDNQDEASILSLIQNGDRLEFSSEPLEHHKLYGDKDNLLGYAFRTTAVPPKIKGYSGEIDCLVGIDLDGKVTGVKILSNRESPNFMSLLYQSGLPGKLIGLDAKGIREVDTVSGATISSSAIIKDIGLAVQNVSQTILKKDTATTASKRNNYSGMAFLLLIFPMAAALLSMFIPKKKYLKLISMALSILIIGIYLNTPITIGSILNLPSHLFSRGSLALAILLIFAIATALLKGNLYCTHICPFGALQDCSALAKKQKSTCSTLVARYISTLRYIMVLLALALFFPLKSMAFERIEPFTLLFSRDHITLVWIQAGVILLAAIFFKRIWCRFLCPTGLFMDTVADIGVRLRNLLRHKVKRT